MYCDIFREKREKLGLTQSQFAMMLGVSMNTYRGYEYGEYMPSSPVLIKMIANGIDVNEVFAEEIAYEKKLLDKKKLYKTSLTPITKSEQRGRRV